MTLIGADAAAQGRGRRHDLRHLGLDLHPPQYIDPVIGRRGDVKTYACMNGLVLPGRQVFLVDTHVNYDPSAEQLAEITLLAVEEICASASVPKVALLSHSNFGSSDQPSAVKMRETLALLREAGARPRGRRRDARRRRARPGLSRRV